MDTLATVIREKALSLGFDDCRFTEATPPETGLHYKQWIESGHHGTMGYLERQLEKRLDPQKILPQVKTIISLAMNYNSGKAPSPTLKGQVARYAQYRDYHETLGERLKILAEFIDETGLPDSRSLWYLDTGPILERDFGQKSGLGFVGKNTNLIHRKLGNWFFISEILTTLELPSDPSQKNRCGTCTQCLTVCPTQAFTAPFQLDARRCIAYLTIELKGSIPVEFRPLIGNRVFGCDDCLDICPWNRFAREAQTLKPYYRPDLAEPDLIGWLSMSETEFKEVFRHTPLYRSKRRGIFRNICVVLGNTGTPKALPALQRLLTDPEPIVVEHAQWAIQEIEQRHPWND